MNLKTLQVTTWLMTTGRQRKQTCIPDPTEAKVQDDRFLSRHRWIHSQQPGLACSQPTEQLDVFPGVVSATPTVSV